MFKIHLSTSQENTLRSQTPQRYMEVSSGGIACTSTSNSAKLTGNITNFNDNESPTIELCRIRRKRVQRIRNCHV